MMRNLPLTRWDILKLVALALMFIDHAGAFHFEQEQWLRAIGRACAPIFLFLAGFAPHYRFSPRLLCFALLLTLVDWYVKGEPNALNILWSILAMRALLGWLERRGKMRLRLHEWCIASIPYLLLLGVLQYTPFWILFGLCGYVYKHQGHYAPKTPQYFLMIVVAFYAVVYATFSEFTLPSSMVMLVGLMLMLWLILWFVRAPLAAVSGPAWCKTLSRYSAEIYVGHLLLLIVITGKAL